MYHRIEFWRSLSSLSSAITTFYWVWICFMAHLLSLLLIPKSFLNFWLFFYWLGKNFFCSQKSHMESALSTDDVDYQKYLAKVWNILLKSMPRTSSLCRKVLFYNRSPQRSYFFVHMKYSFCHKTNMTWFSEIVRFLNIFGSDSQHGQRQSE